MLLFVTRCTTKPSFILSAFRNDELATYSFVAGPAAVFFFEVRGFWNTTPATLSLPANLRETPHSTLWLSPTTLAITFLSPDAYNGRMPISARNKLRGTIEEVELGDVMAHIVVRVGDNFIESAITRRSADELKLKKGDTVFAVVKATEVMIQKD
jgi:molybdopterin-binding protein